MVREITQQIYKFNELSKGVQRKVIEEYKKNIDYPFLEDGIKDKLNELLLKNDIKTISGLEVYYSLSYCQGDGACFIGVFEWKNFKIYVEHSGNYYHYNSKTIDINNKETGEEPENYEEVYKNFNALYIDICKELEKVGYEYIEEENKDENIKDNIEINEYEFYENGERF